MIHGYGDNQQVKVNAKALSNKITVMATDSISEFMELAEKWATSMTLVDGVSYGAKYYAQKAKEDATLTQTLSSEFEQEKEDIREDIQEAIIAYVITSPDCKGEKGDKGDTGERGPAFTEAATSSTLGIVMPDNTTTSVDANGVLSANIPSNISSFTNDTGYITSSALTPYLPKSGGTMTGALTFADNTWNSMGDDASIGDKNVAGHICIKPNNSTYDNSGGISFHNSSGTALVQLNASSGALTSSGSVGISNNAVKMSYNSTTQSVDFVFG